MVGKNFGIYSPQLAKLHLNNPPWLEKTLAFTHLDWLKLHLNYPPWLVKILEFTHLN